MEKEKVENMLLGLAVGDAFGLGIEFQNRDWIIKNIDFTRFVNKREGKYAERYKLGYYSDDTEQSIGLIRALMDSRKFSERLLLEMWKEEYERSKREKGFSRQGYSSNTQDWLEGRKTPQDLLASQNKEDPGCAPPMRAVPLGLIDSKLINPYAIINADASNNFPKAEASSILVARASEYLIVQDGDQKSIFSYCKKFISDEDTLRYLEQVDKLPPELDNSEFEALCGPQPMPNFKHREVVGLPCSAMRVAGAALYVLKYSDSAFSGLKKAIQLGGDVDTVASICTGILAGKYGLNSIPKFMTEKTEGKEYLRKIASEFVAYLSK